jgi:hypothetical protein
MTRASTVRLALLAATVLCFDARPARAEVADPPRSTPTVLVLPFAGVYSYQSTDKAAYLPGPRVGAILGARILPWMSINAESTYDWSLLRGGEDVGVSEYVVAFAVSPLFHFALGRAELVFGPELGYFVRSASIQLTQAGTPASDSSTGFAAGLNAGIFARVGRYVSLGGLLSLELRDNRRSCDSRAGQPETCTTAFLHVDDLFSVNAAALF